MTTTRGKSFPYWQKRTIFVLWLTYGMLYLGRANLAVALPLIEVQFGWTTISTGLVSSAFFGVYAIGQLINGSLGDHLSTRYFVFVGLLGTALMNFLFGFSGSLVMMSLVWGANGIFQSTGWGPIVKTASHWVTPEQRNKVSAILGTSFVLGALASWVLAGWIIETYHRWELAFGIPALILFVHAWVWVIFIRDNPAQAGFTIEGIPTKQPKTHLTLGECVRNTVDFLRQPHLLLLALTTIFQGMIKDGINLWMPTLLMQTQNLSIGNAVSYSLIVPFLGFVGVLAASWLNEFLGGDDRRSVIILFAVGSVIAFGVSWSFAKASALSLSILIGLCSLVINGINVLLLSSIPLRFANSGKSSTLAGYLDFASYVGSGTMTIITGFVANYWSWESVATIWAVLFVLGGLSMVANTHLSSDELGQKVAATRG